MPREKLNRNAYFLEPLVSTGTCTLASSSRGRLGTVNGRGRDPKLAAQEVPGFSRAADHRCCIDARDA